MGLWVVGGRLLEGVNLGSPPLRGDRDPGYCYSVFTLPGRALRSVRVLLPLHRLSACLLAEVL